MKVLPEIALIEKAMQAGDVFDRHQTTQIALEFGARLYIQT
ncbi:hypothetical protein [Acidovorax sp. SUPP3334]|nr:hypothetical protein [Acidovorax sp. SUPP3334]GKT20831.1 hypothetical protein AVHM3334_02585 [Acidovorax sp. SUPP3334]